MSLYNYQQCIRETIVDKIGNNPQEKANALNLFEAICENEMSLEEIVDAIKKDTLPKRYTVND